MKKAKIIQDGVYSEMYRVRWPDGEISDMVNKTRVKEYVRVWDENEKNLQNTAG